MTEIPPIRSQLLLDAPGLAVHDVRCAEVLPAIGDEEHVDALEVVLPMAGLFVRESRRPGRRTCLGSEIGDPTRVLFLQPGERQRVRHPLGGLDRSIAITVRPAVARALRGAPGPLPSSRPASPAAHLFARRLAAALAGARLDGLSGTDLTLTLLDAVLPDARSERAAAARAVPRRVRALADDTRLVLAERIGDRLTLAELGRLVGSSPFHLARSFRRVTGVSIHAYRTQLRVRGVLARIEAGERDLTALALDHGFSDHSHMTNAFSRVLGRPPSAFRGGSAGRDLREMRTILQA